MKNKIIGLQFFFNAIISIAIVFFVQYSCFGSDYNNSNTKLLLYTQPENSKKFIDVAFWKSTQRVVSSFGDTISSAGVNRFGQNSIYFDGNGDGITINNISALQLGSKDFCIQAFVYLLDFNTDSDIIDENLDGSSGYAFYVQTSGTPIFIWGNGSWNPFSSSISIPLNKWVHIAVLRTSGTAKFYIDGVFDVSTSISNITDTGLNVIYIGNNNNNGKPMHGYIYGLTVTIGNSVYSGNFNPPTPGLFPEFEHNLSKKKY